MIPIVTRSRSNNSQTRSKGNPVLKHRLLSRAGLLRVLTALFFAVILFRFSTKAADFNVYFLAAERFLHGASIHIAEANLFSYFTAAALFFVPLAPLGYGAAKIVFCILSFAGFIIGVRIINSHISTKENHAMWAFIISFAFAMRFFLAVFDNQQTDFLVFCLLLLGLHYYTRNNYRAALLWSAGAILKTNPLFIVLLPIFQRRFMCAAVMLVSTAALVMTPDLLRIGITRATVETPEITSIELPRVLIDRKDRYPMISYPLTALPQTRFAYLKEYLSITFGGGGPNWWEDTSNYLNQSLTRIAMYYLPERIPSVAVFLTLCGAFSLALLNLVRRNRRDIFVLGLMFYAAFVLIGPMSSKPHFIVMYGLLLFAWQNLFAFFNWSKLLLLAVVSVTLGLTSRGVMSFYSDIFALAGHIGIAALVLWIYVYALLCKGSSNSTQ